MSENEELIKLNEKMSDVMQKVDRLYGTLVDTELNGAGVITRLSRLEKKLLKLEKYIWLLVGILSCGTIPLGTKILPIIKDYLKG
jgi:hypothetical protein